MGRELSVNRLDIMKNGTVVIRDSGDRFICGRNDFTNALSTCFYNRDVTYLIIDYPETKGKLSVKCEDSAWDEKEFELEFASINKNVVDDICAEYIKEDNIELEREHRMLEDAHCARQNTRTVKDFQEFSDLIDSLQEHIDSYCEHAKLYADYIRTLNLAHNEKTTATYILLTLSE